MVEQTCILCKYWQYDPGHPGYSEMTPGYEATEFCDKGHWWMSGDDYQGQEDRRENLLTARNCPDFVDFREEAKNEPN